jgi:nucleoside phosphorylase/DNA-binding NarL/FixJ family response regulator
MRVLLVDDNLDRAEKIKSSIASVGDGTELIHTTNLMDAKSSLREGAVDLLLLDVMIPNRPGEEPGTENSVRLLTELADVGEIPKPRKILGLTAYGEVAAKVADAFASQTWAVIVTPEVSNTWLDTLHSCIRYMRNESSGGGIEASKRNNAGLGESHVARRGLIEEDRIDLLILTALDEPEMEAVRRYTWEWSAAEPVNDITFIRRAQIVIGERRFRAVAAVADRMGMVATAILASNLFHVFRPRVCVMPGICAGIPKKTELGDVLFAECCWNHQSGKHAVEDDRGSIFEIDPHQLDVDPGVTACMRELSRDSAFFSRIWSEGPTRSPTPPKLVIGPVASGSSVLADSSVVKDVQRQQRKVNGIEMELYGLYAAARLGPTPRSLVFGLKAVCDFANESKGDGYQAFASYASARVLREAVERYLARWIPVGN